MGKSELIDKSCVTEIIHHTNSYGARHTQPNRRVMYQDFCGNSWIQFSVLTYIEVEGR